MSADLIRRYLALKDRKEALDAQVKEVTAELEAVQAALLERWSEDGTTSQRVDGRLVSLRRQAFATVIDSDYDRAARALKEAGLDHLLRPNTQTLSALLREYEAEGRPLPPSFEGAIGIYERYSLSVRNGRH